MADSSSSSACSGSRFGRRRYFLNRQPCWPCSRILAAPTGILFSLLEAREIEADWLLALHIGHFGPLDLEPFYSVILGVCVLVLAGSGLSLWFKTRRRAS